jgi:hypothetical protein
MRPVAPLLAALALLAAPAVATAQSPFAPLPQAAPPEAPTVVVSNNGSGDGLQTWQELLIFGAGLILLVGIGWAIAADARTKAPVTDREMAHPGMGGATKTNRSAKQKERARAKAKLGRQQRKRNRGR